MGADHPRMAYFQQHQDVEDYFLQCNCEESEQIYSKRSLGEIQIEHAE